MVKDERHFVKFDRAFGASFSILYPMLPQAAVYAVGLHATLLRTLSDNTPSAAERA